MPQPNLTLGAVGSPKKAQERPRAPKSVPRDSQRAPRVTSRSTEEALETHRGAPGATKVAQKSAQRGPESSPERVGRDTIDAKVVTAAEKVNFVESAPRSSPLERQRLGSPQINPKSAKNRAQAAPDALEMPQHV